MPAKFNTQRYVYFRALRCFHECGEDELSGLNEKTQDFHEKLQRMVKEGKCPDGPPGPKPPKPDFENMTCVQEDVDVCLDWVKHLPPKKGSPYPGVCRWDTLELLKTISLEIHFRIPPLSCIYIHPTSNSLNCFDHTMHGHISQYITCSCGAYHSSYN